MKTRFFIYIGFALVCGLCIGLYFINPSLPILQVIMSFGASLIGAIFVSISIEIINNSKQKKAVNSIQKQMLSSVKQSFKSFYLWLGNYLVRKFSLSKIDLSKIENSNQLFSELAFASHNKLKQNEGNNEEIDVENIIDVVSGKINPLIMSVEQLLRLINEEIATLIANEVIDEEDVTYFNKIKEHLLDAQESENYEELCTEIVEILNLVNEKQFLRLELDELLSERLKRKLAV